mgnify:FL=1
MIIGQIYEKKGNLLYLCVNFMTECFNNISESGFSTLLDVLLAGKSPGREGWRLLLAGLDDGQDESLRTLAAEAARKRFGNGIFIRGLVEISSWCGNNCYYCGLRRSNRFASRYRLFQEQILDCCREGARLGFGTFVLQGGEDGEQDEDWIEELVGKLRAEFPGHAITLSVG